MSRHANPKRIGVICSIGSSQRTAAVLQQQKEEIEECSFGHGVTGDVFLFLMLPILNQNLKFLKLLCVNSPGGLAKSGHCNPKVQVQSRRCAQNRARGAPKGKDALGRRVTGRGHSRLEKKPRDSLSFFVCCCCPDAVGDCTILCSITVYNIYIYYRHVFMIHYVSNKLWLSQQVFTYIYIYIYIFCQFCSSES